MREKINVIALLSKLQEVKCSNPKCEMDANVVLLPTLDFHHNNPLEKEFSWRNLSRYKIEKIVELLSREDVRISCSNCHFLDTASFFKQVKDIILDKKILLRSLCEIENLINDKVQTNYNYYYPRKHYFRRWLKKRFIIEQLYNGHCIGCGKITVYNNLPSLTFHPRDPSKKDLLWSKDFVRLSIPEIIHTLIVEDIVCLCVNCHRMIDSYSFLLNCNEILTKVQYKNKDFYVEKIKAFYNTLEKNIKNFQFKSIKVTDPLKFVYRWGKRKNDGSNLM